ncbi:hypothetical protein N324_04408, partial [Chlamydotis macqueenii]
QGSTEVIKLVAVKLALLKFKDEPVNLVTDSVYGAGIVARLDYSMIKNVDNSFLMAELRMLWSLINQRKNDFYVMHVRSHTDLPGPIMEGNQLADFYTMSAIVPNRFEQAKLSHSFYHQNARALRRYFQLTMTQACSILAACPDCQLLAPLPAKEGVNPCGIKGNKLWQTDVTHFGGFGKMKYVHATVNTFSGYLVATAHMGERARDVCKHWLTCFAILGVPQRVKTDIGPAYSSAHVRVFLQQSGTEHITGIPHSPTGQTIIERSHRILKEQLNKQ